MWPHGDWLLNARNNDDGTPHNIIALKKKIAKDEKNEEYKKEVATLLNR